VVRNVVLISLQPGATDEQVDRVVTAFQALPVDGLVSMTIGRDAGLRDGNVDLALVSDFDDEASYRAYDADEEHNRIRRELVAPIATRVDRCQFRL
jgi:hypothetical protein